MTDQDDIVRTGHLLAEAARKAILPYFRGDMLDVEDKLPDGRFDPVTAADRAAEEAMRKVLAVQRPQDAVKGEEFGTQDGTSGLTWVLDPIDGTRAFVAGTPTWGVLIALCDESGPIYGIIDQPYIGERFEGGFGRAGLSGPHGDRALSVLGDRALSESALFTTFPEVGTAQDRAGFDAVAARVQMTRYGLDCYAYALLAAGQIDLVIEAGLEAHDICAPIAVIEAAGGIVTDWRGGNVHQGGRCVAAAGKQQHEEALKILSTY